MRITPGRNRSVDLAILGGGAAGLAAAREGRRRGASTLLVNPGPLGGDCTFTGCVPSKAVIEASLQGASFSAAFQRARDVSGHIAATESAAVLAAEGIEIVDDRGALLGPGRIRAGGGEITARGVVLALGSHPARPPIPGLADVEPLTSETLWALETAPSSLAVIGGGPMGCELSQALARLGVAVTLIEIEPRVLAGDEPAASAIVEAELAAAGVLVKTGARLERIEPGPGGAVLHHGDGTVTEHERLLIATGRQPATQGTGLAEAGVELDRDGAVAVGPDLATSLERVWAAGDVTGALQLTHAADQMGRLAAANSLRRVGRLRFRPERIPRVTFTTPEVARVGLSEAEAARSISGARVAELPLHEHDRALLAGTTNGYLKLIAAPRRPAGNLGGGRLVGATVVAPRAGELIAELTLALTTRTFIGRLATTAHPYPTWSYAIPKAAAQFFTTVEGRSARPARA